MEAWGQRGLLELEAEERLAIACEKSPTQDPVISKLRGAFRVGQPPPPLAPRAPLSHVSSQHLVMFPL